MAFFYAGIALPFASLWALAFFVPTLVIARYSGIAREETYLEREFSDDYRHFGPPRGAGSSLKAATVSRRPRASVDARRGRDRIGNHPGGGLTLQSGCPAGSRSRI